MELAYWDIRGLAQPIRLLLEFTAEKYTDTKYVCGEAPNYDKSCWFDVKDSLNLDFPNLPYLVHGDARITQSNAIMRYISRRHKLCGVSETEKMRVDMLENEAMDFRNAFVRLCYSKQFNELRDEYLRQIVEKIKRFSLFLGDNQWFCGENLTFVDFIMYELLDQHRILSSSVLDSFSNVQQLMVRFEQLPAIKNYMSSERFIKSPINNRMAQFGN